MQLLFIQIILNQSKMSWLLCCNHSATNSGITPQPVKFKIIRSLHLLNPILDLFVLPKKKQSYKFPKHRLTFLTYQNTNHIPMVYFQSKNHTNQLLLIYCHGSGSNLNNVYNFGGNLMNKYGVSVLLYDYTGDGESNKDFHSYESDIKVVLAWAQHLGYSLSKIILCGYSIGSYSALVVNGPMPRLLISPVCGIIPFVQGTALQYEGEIFDNIENAEKIEARILILHGAKQMVPYSHAEALVDGFRTKNKPESIQLLKVEGVTHSQMPNILLNKQAQAIIENYFEKILTDAKNKKATFVGQKLKEQLKRIAIKIQTQRSNEKL